MRESRADRWSLSHRPAQPVAVLAFALVVGMCATACGTGERAEGASLFGDQAHDLEIDIVNSRRVAHFGQMTTENLTQAAADEGAVVMVAETVEPESDSIYEWSRLVIRMRTVDVGLIGAETEITGCWEYTFEGRFVRGSRSVGCPDGQPLVIVEVEPARIPEGTNDRLAVVLASLDAGAIRADAVAGAFEAAFPDLGSATFDVAVDQDVVGATVTDGTRCVLARRAADGTVDVWVAQSADAVTDAATCPATGALAGLYRDPPH